MARQKILVAGAGLGGLVAALALLRDGHDVQVFEQATQFGEVGAGVQLSANATRVLSLVGVDAAVREVASVPAGKQVRLWNTGQVWKLFDLGQHSVAEYGFPYYTLYRPDLHAVLVQAVRDLAPQALVLGAKVASLDQDAEGVTLVLEDGRRFAGDLLVGADGVHSRVRQGLFGPDSPTFSGCLAWRGVIPAAKLPAHLREPVGTNWVGPGGHVIHYPLRRGEMVNFVGVVERSDWTVESWTAAGSVEECARDFAGWNEDVHTLIASMQQPFKWALMVREPMQQWTRGRVTLLGDAAHPTLPFLAQGACMAIEDGAMLARCLRETQDPQQALHRFEQARVERTTRIVQGAAAQTKRFHNPTLASVEGAVEYVNREWNEARVRERYHWLFDYKVDEVALP